MARLISTGAPAKRSVIVSELQALLARVRQADGGTVLLCPAYWLDAGAPLGAQGRLVDVIPGTGRVLALQMAVERLTGQPSMDTTIREAVARIHYSDLEIKA